MGEFATTGLNMAAWGATQSRTYAPTASWPGFAPSWGPDQYDTQFQSPTSTIFNPFSVVADGSLGQALQIAAEPVPLASPYPLSYLANNQWPVANITANFTIPTEGSSLTVPVDAPNGAQNGWKVGVGYAGASVAFIGTLTSGGATPSGNGTGGSSPWTISNIHVYAGTPGTVITPSSNANAYSLRAYAWMDYVSGALDVNVNQQYGFFVAELRLPAYLSALSPAWWILETGGVANPPAGLQRSEWDIQEMFGATEGNALNAGNILWNTNPSQFWPTPTGVYNFPNGTPQAAYHDYGLLIQPGTETFYLDGLPIASHVGGPDWTQGSPDKEIMLMFQVAAPGTWLDPNSTGKTNPWPQYMYAKWLRAYAPTSGSC